MNLHDFETGKRLLGEVPTERITLGLDVRHRLDQLRMWNLTYLEQDRLLLERIARLDGQRLLDAQRAVGIDIVRERWEWQRLKAPLEIVVSDVAQSGFAPLRQHLVRQFASLSHDEKVLWLTNFMFIMTPDLREVTEKVIHILDWLAFGQRRCLLFGGLSGMGKTTYLHWLSSHALGRVEEYRNWVPFVLVDAPRSNLSAKTLPHRMIHACGMTALARGDEEALLQQLTLYVRQCGTVLIGIDEIEHVKHPALRRRVLDISNRLRLPFICSSVSPRRWVDGDSEAEGRWNDYHELKPYTGDRLRSLMAFIELLLPFPETSHLISDPVVTLIQGYTAGILRDIMALIVDTSKLALQRDLPRLTPSMLQEAWAKIQHERVRDFNKTDEEAYCP